MIRTCWCGVAAKTSFNSDYSVCQSCGTLICQTENDSKKFLVKDDETDYYGKKYWLSHQQQDLGTSDIHARARTDLTERNLHWLKALLKYRLPTAKVLELGCSHGSFVALMRQAGFDASGVEMSPWVVNFGMQTFGIPVEVGPLEALGIEPSSLDVLVMMDVLEHLPDPVGTMQKAVSLLKPNGMLFLQTPEFNEDMVYENLVRDKRRFLEMLIPEEHLYLFSKSSVTRLFKDLGLNCIQFEPAIFSEYDMFFAVSRNPLEPNTSTTTETALLSTPSGRMTLAMLDLRDREVALEAQLKHCEADRYARWEQIVTLTEMVKEMEKKQ